jgi:HK97 family phage portal protein
MRNPLATAITRMNAPSGSGGGQLVPSTLNKIAQWSRWGTKRAIDDGFKSSVWVYICIRRLMASAASVPWYAYEGGGDKWEKEENHPLSDLMAQPNPFMSRQQTMEWVIAQLQLAGNSMLKKIVIGGKTRELWPIWELDKIQPVPDRFNFLDRYDFRRDGEAIPILPSEVVHMQLVDPSTPYWGMSPLQAAARVVDTDTEAVQWNKVMLQNRAKPDGVFMIPGQVERDQLDEARMIVREQYGGPDNRGVPFVFGSGMTYTQMSLSPAEMDWLESRKLSREEICAVFGVPLPMVGIYADATLANLETSRSIFWEDTVIPLLDLVQAALNRSITPAFGDPRTLQLRYDTTGVNALREDLSDKIVQFGKLVTSGVPVNVAAQRLQLGIDAIEGGDIGLVPATMIPLTMAGSGEPSTTPPAEL